jgi:hypothetical protein
VGWVHHDDCGASLQDGEHGDNNPDGLLEAKRHNLLALDIGKEALGKSAGEDVELLIGKHLLG